MSSWDKLYYDAYICCLQVVYPMQYNIENNGGLWSDVPRKSRYMETFAELFAATTGKEYRKSETCFSWYRSF